MLAVLAGCLLLSAAQCHETFYMAAVLEHARFGNYSDEPQFTVSNNLAVYKRAAWIARDKGADIIVFPEYGLFLPDWRLELGAFVEYVPDPKKERVTPCKHPDDYLTRPILFQLSCIARENSIVVVANMGDVQDCLGQKGCRSDGKFYFNTNVVFDRDGTLLLKYHKENLFNEPGYDPAREPQEPIFDIDIGRFSTFICYDIQFERMGQVSRKFKVDGVAFPTMWDEEPPQMTSLQVLESWSVANNLTLLAADINHPGSGSVGSGIFNGKLGTIVYTYNPDGLSKLMVAKVPKFGHSLSSHSFSTVAVTRHDSWPWRDDGKDVHKECSVLRLGEPQDEYQEFRCFPENTSRYTFVKLNGPFGRVDACNNGMCCSLEYESTQLEESFYLGVYNGTQNSQNSTSWWEENCVLTICESVEGVECADFPRRSRTIFSRIVLRGNFTAEDVYPSIVDSGMRLVPRKEWRHEKCEESGFTDCMNFEHSMGKRIIAVGMKGRCYERDPDRNVGVTSKTSTITSGGFNFVLSMVACCYFYIQLLFLYHPKFISL